MSAIQSGIYLEYASQRWQGTIKLLNNNHPRNIDADVGNASNFDGCIGASGDVLAYDNIIQCLCMWH